MTQTSKHTPTPWRLQKDIKAFRHIAGSMDENAIYAGLSPLCEMAGHYNAETDAAFIVRAVNSHEALKECLENVLSDLQSKRLVHEDGNENAISEVKEVLKLAEEI